MSITIKSVTLKTLNQGEKINDNILKWCNYYKDGSATKEFTDINLINIFLLLNPYLKIV